MIQQMAYLCEWYFIFMFKCIQILGNMNITNDKSDIKRFQRKDISNN